jgi:hypothetical protein
MKNLATATLYLCLVAGAAQATTVHDEATDGDLPGILGAIGSAANVDLGLLPAGVSTVIGTIDAGTLGGPVDDGPDEFDVVTFSVAGNFSVDITDVSGNVGGALYGDGGGCCYTFLGSGGFSIGATTDVFASLGALGAGVYAFSIVPSGNLGQHGYSFSINVASSVDAPVPLPAGVVLLATGLGGLGLASRRRNAHGTHSEV